MPSASELKRLSDESDWRVHELNRLNAAANESLKQQRYSDAVEFYEQAATFGTNIYQAAGTAKSLLKLDRPADALKVLNKLNRNETLDEDCWRLKVECCLKLKDYKQAFAICDQAAIQRYPFQIAWLLRSEVYKSLGDVESAKRSLQEGLWHSLRYHQPKQDLVDALYAMGVEPSFDVPGSVDGNQVVLKNIRKLLALDHVVNERELFALYKCSFDGIGIGGGQPFVNAWQFIDRKNPIEQISLDNRDGVLELYCNMDTTAVDANALSEFGKLTSDADFQKSQLEPAKKSIDSHWFSVPLSTRRYISCKNGFLFVDFSDPDMKRLQLVARFFDKPRAPATPPLSASQFDVHTKKVGQLLKQREFSGAQSEIVSKWEAICATSDLDERRQRLTREKDFLIASQKPTPAIQKYLQAAPLGYISQDIQAKVHMDVEFPTVDDYLSHRWHIKPSATGLAPTDKIYLLWAESYSVIRVTQSCELYRKLEEKFGQKETTLEKLTQGDLLTGKLLDDATYNDRQ